MQKRVASWAFVVAALALTAWAVVSYVSPGVECRGETMGPGDVCHYSSTTREATERTQTYEERVATVRQQVPFVIALGLAATAFGVIVAVRSGEEGHRAVDDPVLLHQRDLGHPLADELGEEER